MKKLLFGLIATVMFSFVGNASSFYEKSASCFSSIIDFVKHYKIKCIVHLGGLGEYGIDFDFDWPFWEGGSTLDTSSSKLSADGTSLTMTFNKKLPVDVLSVSTDTRGVQINTPIKGNLTSITVLKGDYKVTNGNTVTLKVITR